MKVNGENVSEKIPERCRHEPMGTYGTYGYWYFAGWEENFKEYTDGLKCEEWIEANQNWLDAVSTDASVQREIYAAIQAQDFRRGQCGGCI